MKQNYDVLIKIHIIDFLLMYKLSKDNLEMFFFVIRSKEGVNNI